MKRIEQPDGEKGSCFTAMNHNRPTGYNRPMSDGFIFPVMVSFCQASARRTGRSIPALVKNGVFFNSAFIGICCEIGEFPRDGLQFFRAGHGRFSPSRAKKRDIQMD
jgi:hypothetical protein